MPAGAPTQSPSSAPPVASAVGVPLPALTCPGGMAVGGGRLIRDHLAELLAWFLVGVTLMSFLYAGTGGANGGQRGLPGNDSFYHLKMALLLPEIGLPETFPWLSTTIFSDRFVSHHYGFHVLLAAGVRVSTMLGAADPMQAARWFNAVCFGGVMLVLNLLLIAGGVRHRSVWLVLFLLLPNQFFARHMFIRAMCPSLLCLLLILLAMFRGRYRTVGVLIFLYVHLYFGALMYTPVLVGAYIAAGWLGPREQRIDWRLPGYAFAGWLAGLIIHPYGGWHAIEFLRIQVLGSGLDPDIPVGREWQSYSPAWFFVQMSAAMLGLLAVTLCVRGRRGPRLDVPETALLMVNLVFLLLTLKARRFIEYWPILNLLGCAYLWRPMFRRPSPTAEVGGKSAGHRGLSAGHVRLFVAGTAFGILAGATVVIAPRLHVEAFVAEWRLWLFALCPLAVMGVAGGNQDGAGSAALGPRGTARRVLFDLVSAGVLVGLTGAVVAVAMGRKTWPGPALGLPWGVWFGLALVLPLLAWAAARRAPDAGGRPGTAGVPGSTGSPQGRSGPGARHTSAARMCRGERILGGASLSLLALLTAAGPLVGVQRSQRCSFNLAAIADTLGWVADHSAPGEIIFTDDWDMFGVFFYFNHHNHYVVGLDPKFTHARDPVLWERYVRITRGNVPSVIETREFSDGPKQDGKRAASAPRDPVPPPETRMTRPAGARAAAEPVRSIEPSAVSTQPVPAGGATEPPGGMAAVPVIDRATDPTAATTAKSVAMASAKPIAAVSAKPIAAVSARTTAETTTESTTAASAGPTAATSTAASGGPGIGTTTGPAIPASGGPSIGMTTGPAIPASGGPGIGTTTGPAIPASGGPSIGTTTGPAIPASGGPSIGTTTGPAIPASGGPSIGMTARPTAEMTAGSIAGRAAGVSERPPRTSPARIGELASGDERRREVASPSTRTRVVLGDMVTYFGARWAIVDAEHASMANLLHRSPEVAVLSYSTAARGSNNRPLYQVFRLRSADRLDSLGTRP